jgi:hypothetical protein
MLTTPNLTSSLFMVMIVLILGGFSLASSGPFTLALENCPPGSLPPGWLIAATNPQDRLAEWAVVLDAGSAEASKVLSLTKIYNGSRGVFNLCWNPQVVFMDGEIEVKVRANSGTIDQGGGLIWRARDPNNYYVLRYNPLEANFRLYFVKDGQRKMLADKGGLTIKTGEWFTLKIVHRGDKIEGWLNGGKLLEATDRTFPEAGGIGFWTKADAATSFAGLHVQP